MIASLGTRSKSLQVQYSRLDESPLIVRKRLASAFNVREPRSGIRRSGILCITVFARHG